MQIMGPPVISDFNLNTEGSCFFCFKMIHMKKHEPDLVTTRRFQNYSVHYLVRYLEMDMRKVFNDEGQTPLNLLEQVQRSRLKVELCEKCTSLNKTFSELCKQLEKLEMEINSSLNLIHDMLLGADQSDKNQNRELTKFPSNTAMGKELLQIVGVLREETIQKCSQKLRVTSPRIKITKLTKKQIDAKLSKSPASFEFSKLEEVTSVKSIEIQNIEMDIEPQNEDFFSDNDSRHYEIDSEAMDDKHAKITTDPRGTELKVNKTSFIIISAKYKPPKKIGKYNFNHATGKWKCSCCPLELTIRTGIYLHYRSVHQKIRFRYVTRGKQFVRQSDYNRHHKSAHVGVRFKCPVCNKLFNQKHGMLAHERAASCRKGKG